MRRPASLALLALTLALSPTPSFASYGSPPPPPDPRTGSAPERGSWSDNDATPRQRAERQFADAYDDVARAGRDAERGNAASATKRYKRALSRCQDAVELDSTYHEAWNLIGFTSRKLGDYPRSFAAYRVALRLKPDFALAHEYFGEGLAETGDLAGARQQLELLRRCGTPELIADLTEAIAKQEKAHPEAAGAAGH